jgi:AcrR family transcriptional regulator
MRRLAQELDVWPMAVYRYFRDKNELLEAMAAAAAARNSLPSGGGSWRTQMRRLLGESRAAIGGAVSRGRLASGGGRLSEAGLRILRYGGLDELDASRAWGALFGYALAFSQDHDAEFEFGLECLLDGLEARLTGER